MLGIGYLRKPWHLTVWRDTKGLLFEGIRFPDNLFYHIKGVSLHQWKFYDCIPGWLQVVNGVYNDV